MNTVRVTIAVSGTDDNGKARSFSGSGTFSCYDATTGSITATSTQVKIADQSTTADLVSFIYLENNGAVDVAIGTNDGTASKSLVVPPGAALFVPAPTRDIITTGTIGGQAAEVFVWTDSGTAEVHYILFY